jgi:hypothetical protein
MIPLLIACSGGPGMMELIEAREQRGFVLFVATAVALVLVAVAIPVVRRRKLRAWLPLGILALAHPGWWMGARHGDCGHMIAAIDIPYTIGALVLAGLITWRAAVVDRRPL